MYRIKFIHSSPKKFIKIWDVLTILWEKCWFFFEITYILSFQTQLRIQECWDKFFILDKILNPEKFCINGKTSPDLTPQDFYLWGYVKDRVFQDPSNSIENLKLAITQAIDDIQP